MQFQDNFGVCKTFRPSLLQVFVLSRILKKNRKTDMQDIGFHQNQIIDMNVDNSEDSDSSADVFLELAEAWSYVRKWYNFRKSGRTDSSSVAFHKNKSKVTKDEPKAKTIHFQDLPVSVQVNIFSWLDVKSLSKAAMVSRQWYNFTSDEILWGNKLACDSQKWQVIDHLSYPELYKDTNADLSSKEIYLSCCPECRTQRQKTNFKFHIPRISFYFGLSVPRVVMFGPGLESETSGIVKNIFSDPNSPCSIKGMFPGQFEGIGSGVSLQFDGGLINLITLYSASRNEREANSANGVRRNKFLVERNLDEDAEGGIGADNINLSVTLTQPVRDLCSTVDAFIFVVDSTMSKNKVKLGIEELKVMMSSRSLKTSAPLLVLSCVPGAQIQQYSSISVANELGLRELNRPWQIRACHVATLYGLLPGFQWILDEVMNS